MIEIVNAPFPACLAFGARCEPMWSTEIAETISGVETAAPRWFHTRYVYDVSPPVKTTDDYSLLRAHFHAVRGSAYGFLFKDPTDFSVTAAATNGEQGITAEADASSEGYQLLKRYSSGARTYDRRIAHPVAGITIYRTRSAVTTDVTGSATVDLTDGTFTVSGDAEGDVYTWAGEFRVACRYVSDRLPAAIINKQPGADGKFYIDCPNILLIELREP